MHLRFGHRHLWPNISAHARERSCICLTVGIVWTWMFTSWYVCRPYFRFSGRHVRSIYYFRPQWPWFTTVLLTCTKHKPSRGNRLAIDHVFKLRCVYFRFGFAANIWNFPVPVRSALEQYSRSSVRMAVVNIYEVVPMPLNQFRWCRNYALILKSS